MAGQMVHLEIPAADPAKAQEFWGGLFGWEFQEFPGAPGGYYMTRFSETTGGAIYGADGDSRGTRTYFDVDDINAGNGARRASSAARPATPRPSRAWAGSRSARTPRATSSGSGRPTTNAPGDVSRRGGGGRGPPPRPSRSLAARTWVTATRKGRHALLPISRGGPAQAPHRVPREREAPDRGGHGPRGLHRERVDPVPPRVALPREGARRVHADRARGVGSRHARAPPPEHVRRRTRGRRDLGAADAHVELGRRDLASAGPRARWTTSSATARATRSCSSTRGRARSRRSSATSRTRTATTS